MKTQMINVILMWVTCLAVIIFCMVGVILMMGWMPTLVSNLSNNATTSCSADGADIECIFQSNEGDVVELPRPIYANYLADSKVIERTAFVKNNSLRIINFA